MFVLYVIYGLFMILKFDSLKSNLLDLLMCRCLGFWEIASHWIPHLDVPLDSFLWQEGGLFVLLEGSTIPICFSPMGKLGDPQSGERKLDSSSLYIHLFMSFTWQPRQNASKHLHPCHQLFMWTSKRAATDGDHWITLTKFIQGLKAPVRPMPVRGGEAW